MRKNAIPNFIEKTWEMLEGQVYGSIIRWKHDGNSF